MLQVVFFVSGFFVLGNSVVGLGFVFVVSSVLLFCFVFLAFPRLDTVTFLKWPVVREKKVPFEKCLVMVALYILMLTSKNHISFSSLKSFFFAPERVWVYAKRKPAKI